MTSFTSLLSSIGGGQPSAPQPKQTPNTTRPTTIARTPTLPSGTRPAVASNVAAGVKRKPDDQAGPPNAKLVKTEVLVPMKPTVQANSQSVVKPASSTPTSATPYRGTARAGGPTNPSATVSKPVARPAASASASISVQPSTTNGVVKPKRGFAAILEKAKAAQEVVKATAGTSTIKHKSVVKLTKRERQKMQDEATQQQKALGKVGKTGKMAAVDRSRSGTPVDAMNTMQKKQAGPAYKGTMRKPVERQESTYKGTMNKAGAGGSSAKPAAKKKPGQGRYGGYASWSDLDDAEEEEDYDSDGSSDMMDAGFDDMEFEERRALQAAKKEDQEALEEEERHRREKMERKKKLQALSKSAAAKKKY